MGNIKNNVRVFGNSESANVNPTSSYDSQGIIGNGFQPGTVISSTDVNTVLNQATFAASSLISAINNATDYAGVFTIGTTKDTASTEIEVVSGLTDALKGIKVNAAGTADSAGTATNVNVSNNDGGDNANVSFSIGTGTYSKTVNNVAHADKASNADVTTLTDGVKSDVVSFKIGNGTAYTKTIDNVQNATNTANANVSDNDSGDNATVSFQIGNGTAYSKTVNNVAHASSADTAGSAGKLSSPVTLSFEGDASGSGTLTGNGETVTVSLDVSKSAALDSVNVGSSSSPVYFNANGQPAACGNELGVNISGNASTATTAADYNTSSGTIKEKFDEIDKAVNSINNYSITFVDGVLTISEIAKS